jgi:hypothetical protein
MLYSNSSLEALTSSSSLGKAPQPTSKSLQQPVPRGAKSASPNTQSLVQQQSLLQRIPALAVLPTQPVAPAQPGAERCGSFKARGFSVLRENTNAVGLIKHVRSHGHIIYTIDVTFSRSAQVQTIDVEGAYCLADEEDMRFITRSFPLDTDVREIETYFAREYDPNKHIPLA